MNCGNVWLFITIGLLLCLISPSLQLCAGSTLSGSRHLQTILGAKDEQEMTARLGKEPGFHGCLPCSYDEIQELGREGPAAEDLSQMPLCQYGGSSTETPPT